MNELSPRREQSLAFIKSPDLLNMATELIMSLNWFEELKRTVGR